jgi:hypothetical protein
MKIKYFIKTNFYKIFFCYQYKYCVRYIKNAALIAALYSVSKVVKNFINQPCGCWRWLWLCCKQLCRVV